MKSEEITADFQFIGNRVSSFKLDTRLINNRGQKPEIKFDFDYNVKIIEANDKLIGVIEFIVSAKATIKKSIFFKMDLVMEAAFARAAEIETEVPFQDMLEINGLVTLTQISRAYLLSVTSQSGIPPVKMPMINVIKLREMKKKKNEKNHQI
jgi:preprotein translocase subunit SecB